jgi:1,4-alpha-glucan branching enzyme
MSISKEIIPERGVCRITFIFTDSLVDHPKEVSIVGDFNNWDPQHDRMQKSTKGYFFDTIELPIGGKYSLRYLVDHGRWENDWQADDYVPSPFGDGYNMIVSCNSAKNPN